MQCAKAISSATAAQHEPRSLSIAVQYFTTALTTWDVILVRNGLCFKDMKFQFLRGLFLAVDRLCLEEMRRPTNR